MAMDRSAGGSGRVVRFNRRHPLPPMARSTSDRMMANYTLSVTPWHLPLHRRPRPQQPLCHSHRPRPIRFYRRPVRQPQLLSVLLLRNVQTRRYSVRRPILQFQIRNRETWFLLVRRVPTQSDPANQRRHQQLSRLLQQLHRQPPKRLLGPLVKTEPRVPRPLKLSLLSGPARQACQRAMSRQSRQQKLARIP